MNLDQLSKQLEAILFSVQEPITLKKVAELMDITKDDAKKVIEILSDYYSKNDRGVMVYEFNGNYQLGTNILYDETLMQLTKDSKSKGLSSSSLEVLSIVAYKQPITRSEIDFVRGVRSDRALHILVDRGLIEVKGRLDKIGRPKIYGTTKQFLRNFSINSLEELPTISEDFEI